MLSVGLGKAIATEVDIVLNKRRLPRVDAVFLSPDEVKKQKEAHAQSGKARSLTFGRILVRPTLVIESLSLGHESHDRETKRTWYADAGIPNYWLLDARARSLECLVLDRDSYRTDQSGRIDAELRPSAFPGLVIPLGTLWTE
jgi:Uma2 family endonuclease